MKYGGLYYVMWYKSLFLILIATNIVICYYLDWFEDIIGGVVKVGKTKTAYRFALRRQRLHRNASANVGGRNACGHHLVLRYWIGV